MKVAFLIDEYVHSRAGTERQLWLLANGLRERGHEVELGVLRATPYVESGGFPARTSVLDVPRVLSARGWWRVYRWGRRLRSQGFRLVQIFFNDSALVGPVALRLSGLVVVSCRRDMGFWYSPGALLILRLSSWAVGALVANSRAAGEAACSAEWVSKSKLHVIRNGIPGPSGPGSAVEAIPRPRKRVGIVANIRPIKRIDDLLRAFARVLEQVPHADLVIVGGGDSSRLQELASELGISDSVRFVGSVENSAEWISTFDVGVICSESEGLSNALLEYMQLGKPVVATDAGGNPEVVTHGHNGLLVPVGDIAAIANAVVRLLRHDDEAQRLGAAGAQLVEREFSVDEMIEHQLGLYRLLLGERLAVEQGSSRCRKEASL